MAQQPPHTSSSNGSSSGSGMREELGRDAERLKQTAGNRAREEAEKRKGQLAQGVQSASSALERAAGALKDDDDAPDWLASAMRQAADSIGRMAHEVDGRSVGEMRQQLGRFARQNPGTFLAASAAAGFAAARVLRAGAERRHSHDSGNDQDSGFASYQGAAGGTRSGVAQTSNQPDGAVPVASAGMAAGGAL